MTSPTRRPPTRLLSSLRVALCAALFALAAQVCLVSASQGAQLSATLDTAVVTLGDPFRLRLTVERSADQSSLFPDPGETLGPYAVHSVAPPTTIDLGQGRWQDELQIELRAFALESAQIPSLTVTLVGDDTLRLQSDPLTVTVVSVLDSTLGQDLRAIKPPLTIAGGWPVWLVAILGALLAVAVALLARRLLRRAPAPKIAAAPVPRAPVDYGREFARVAEMGLLERGALKLYYTHLSDIMRRFLEEHGRIDALERTTSEIAADLHGTDIDDDLCQRIVSFLQKADLVKFAKAEPPESESRAQPGEGSDIVTEIADRRHARRQAAQAAAAAEPVAEGSD